MRRITDAPRPDPVRVVEAALFSAGKPVDEVEIAENTGIGIREVRRALDALVRRYAELDTSLEVGRAGSKWSMHVKAAYAPSAIRLAPMEIPVRLLRTLALVAYHQPILQSDLVEMVGSSAYDHVRELHERGLIRKRLHERSFLLSTTESFPEYFGIPATDREQIRRYLAEKVGIPLPQTDGKGNRRLPSGDEGAAPAAAAEAPPSLTPAE